jgi:hypothetical protein
LAHYVGDVLALSVPAMADIEDEFLDEDELAEQVDLGDCDIVDEDGDGVEDEEILDGIDNDGDIDIDEDVKLLCDVDFDDVDFDDDDDDEEDDDDDDDDDHELFD